MAHIPIDQVEDIWNSVEEPDWSSLRDELTARRSIATDQEMYDRMLESCAFFEDAGQQFPVSAEELHAMLTADIAQGAAS